MFFNSSRSTGKSYTTQGFLIERFIERRERFIYVTRTKKEIESGVLEKAFTKVITKEYPQHQFDIKKDKLYYCEGNTKEPFCYAVALTEVTKKKKENLDGVKWVLFDEYIIDEDSTAGYIKGWKEPELLLNLYHTVDRDTDTVKVIFLANSIKFYNPYHMHPAFSIRKMERDKLFLSDNVLYLWFSASENIARIKNNSKFAKMIANTEYGDYALSGDFIHDRENMVRKMDRPSMCVANISAYGELFGIWRAFDGEVIYLTEKHDASKPTYTLDKSEIKQGITLLTKPLVYPFYIVANLFKKGNVFFSDQTAQNKLDKFITFIL